MNKEQLGTIIQVIGVVFGVIGVLAIVTKHPFIVGLEIICSGLWFLGKKFKQE
jgi:hypothetical protein